MHHKKSGRKFGRNSSHRRAMFRNLAGNLVLHEKIETTDAKAKELRRTVERLITRAARLGDELTVDIGKLNDEQRQRVVARRVHAQRLVAAYLPPTLTKTNSDGTTEEVDLVHKLFHDIAPRFLARIKENKGGGYTRITKSSLRRGDNAPLSVIEILGAASAE
jgi:large subunit ribosomal protein L17